MSCSCTIWGRWVGLTHRHRTHLLRAQMQAWQNMQTLPEPSDVMYMTKLKEIPQRSATKEWRCDSAWYTGRDVYVEARDCQTSRFCSLRAYLHRYTVISSDQYDNHGIYFEKDIQSTSLVETVRCCRLPLLPSEQKVCNDNCLKRNMFKQEQSYIWR